MTKAPEKIWAVEGLGGSILSFNDYSQGGTEYTRTDLIPVLLAAEREKTLREVFDAADKLGNHCLGCGHLCGDPDKDLEILRKSGARSCCPEREIEPLSATLAVMIDTNTEEPK